MSRDWPRAAVVTEEAVRVDGRPIPSSRLRRHQGPVVDGAARAASCAPTSWLTRGEMFHQAVAVSEPLGEEAYEAYTTSLSHGGLLFRRRWGSSTEAEGWR